MRNRVPGWRPSRRRDEGFTLIELMIVLVIMPMVIGAIALGLVAVFHLQTSTTQRLSGSVDMQKVSAQFVKDVENSERIYLGTTPQECGVPGPNVSQLLGLAWSSGSTMVSYIRVPMTNNSTNYALERLYCTNGNMSTPVSTNVLSSDFYLTTSSIQQNPPSVCIGSISPTACITTTNVYNAQNVAAVTLTLYVPMSSSPYTLVASPRGGSAGIPANGNGSFSLTTPLTLLGNDCSSSSGVLSVTNNATLTVQVLNGTTTSPGVLGIANCPASSISLSNNGSIVASSILTGTTNTTGINVGSKPGPYPTTVNSAPGLCDPFQVEVGNANCQNPKYPITPPTYQTTCTGSSCGECTAVKSGHNYNYSCSAGIYTSAQLPTLKGGDNISFAGGSTTVIVPDFNVPNGSTANFGSGVYVFAAPDANAFTTGTNGIGVNGSGVMFYAPTGNISFANNATVNLSGMQPPSSTTYYGITLWLGGTATSPSSSTGVLYLGNNSSQTNAYGGIYVPNGMVVSNQVGNLNTTFMVAGSAVFYQNATITITSP